jgi:hypothetical protein
VLDAVKDQAGLATEAVTGLAAALALAPGYTEVERRTEGGYRRIYMEKPLPG